MGSVINIAQEGTGSTCCPLDTTCIHDDGCEEAQCDFIGTEFENGGTGGRKLSLKDVFERIVNHNRRLSNDDRFSTAPLAQAHLSVQICPKYEIYGHTRYHRDEVRRFPLGRS